MFAAIAGCRYTATEVTIHVDSDLGSRRATSLSVTVRGAAQSSTGAVGDASWPFEGAGAITLPASFGVTPSSTGPRDSAVTMVVELRVAADGADRPALTLRRTARFRFVTQRSLSLPVFLPLACGSLATGCTTVPENECTVTVRCEEQGLTCGNDARCTAVEMMPMPSGTDAAADVPVDVFVTPTAPRPLLPASNSAVTAGALTFSWALPAGADGARVELCSDRTCSTVVRRIDATGTHTDPIGDLARGVHWWRVCARAEGVLGDPSPAWPVTTLGPNGANTANFAFPVLDVDGDGYGDVVVGDPDAANASVYSGGPSGLGTTQDAVLTGGSPNSRFGETIAAAGDVNGDGFGDLVVGAPGESTIYVFHGSASGLPTRPSTILTRAGSPPSAALGTDVAGVGDIDGDGYGDIAVGTGFLATAFLYRGGPMGIVGPAIAISAPDGDARFGTSLAAAGDTNGDGYADVIVGAFGTTNTLGYACVFQGSAAGLGTAPSATVRGAVMNTQFGLSVSGVGDVNGDGLADLAVGEWVRDRVEIHYGDRVTTVRSPPAVLLPPAGVNTPARFGVSVGRAGDFDGDGFDDVVVGAQDAATAAVFSGTASGPSSVPSHVLVPAVGANGSGFGRIVGGGGDFDGDGLGDAWVGVTSAQTASAFAGSATTSTGARPIRWWSGPIGFGVSVVR